MSEPRIRTDFNEPTFSGTTVVTTGIPPNTSTQNYPYTLRDSSVRRDCVDTLTADFRKKINNGEIINNDATIIHGVAKLPRVAIAFGDYLYEYPSGGAVSQQTVSDSEGSNILRFMSNDMLCLKIGTHLYPTTVNTLYPPGEDLDLLGQNALLNAYASAGKSDALLGVSSIEAKKTLETSKRLLSAGPRLLTMLRSLKKGRWIRSDGTVRWTALRRSSRTLSNQWLEYRYGFSQLYYDFKSYAEVYSSLGAKSRVRFTSELTSSNTGLDYDNETQFTACTEVRTIRRFRNDVISAGLIVRPRAAGLEAIRNIGLNAPFQTVWEVIPFSFVLDWFYNTSTLFAAFDGRFFQDVLASWIRRSTRLDGFYSTKYTGRNYVTGTSHIIGDYANCHASGSEAITEYVRIANPVLKPLPQIRINLNWKKLLDLAALIRNGALSLRF